MTVTTDIIISTMKQWVEDKHPISPTKWIEASAKLNLLIGDENDKLYELESKIAKERAELLSQDKMTVAKANVLIEATDDYKEYRKQNARIKQIQEFVRISKKQATLSDTEFKGY